MSKQGDEYKMFLASEWLKRQKMIKSYFQNEYKWKINDEGNYVYYKGKRNLKELKFILDIILQGELCIHKEGLIYNDNKELIGVYIVGEVYVHGDFNGIHQGEGGGYCYPIFCLCNNGYWYSQLNSLDQAIKYVKELEE